VAYDLLQLYDHPNHSSSLLPYPIKSHTAKIRYTLEKHNKQTKSIKTKRGLPKQPSQHQ
jgi:hypothetical protein